MPCPVMEAGKKRLICENPNSTADPCDTCTAELSNERLADMHAALVDEAYARAHA